jgi:hypothetical protein
VAPARISDHCAASAGEEGRWSVTPTLVVVCAWCPTAQVDTAKAHALGQVVSHGLCPVCAAKLEQLATN